MIGNRRSIRPLGGRSLGGRARAAAALVLALLAAACAEARPQRAAVLGATARFADQERRAVEVVVFDIPPGTRIEEIALEGPRGERLATGDFRSVTREAGQGLVVRPGIAVGVTGGSKSGINPSLGIGAQASGDPADAGRRSREVSALLVLPDPAGYQATAADWRLTVRYLDVVGATRRLELRAPR